MADVDKENPDEVMRVYEIMNKELSVQSQLLTEISSGLEGREEVIKIMNLLTKSDKGTTELPSSNEGRAVK